MWRSGVCPSHCSYKEDYLIEYYFIDLVQVDSPGDIFSIFQFQNIYLAKNT